MEESRLFLQVYAQEGDRQACCSALLDRLLTQPSRATRQTIVSCLRRRLARWNPPGWALGDLALLVAEGDREPLQQALLLHAARQDRLLYDFLQLVVAARHSAGETRLDRADVLRFLSAAQAGPHPEVGAWRPGTRSKLACAALSLLRAGGVARAAPPIGSPASGPARGREVWLVPPTVRAAVVRHLARLLREEGVAEADLPSHPDWRLLLMSEERVHLALRALGLSSP